MRWIDAGSIAVAVVCLITLLIGAASLRLSRTTSDFYVASRAVGPLLNASAIGGEYLSAASFLGVAGLVLLRGIDMLWYPIGWTAGYLVLLIFVAAPLRRSGAYTLPDFAELRLESRLLRRVAAALVVLIGLLYLVPQFQGAGLTLEAVTGAPSWVGSVLVVGVVLVNVTIGGMRSVTLTQAFQYWLKLFALLLPVMWLLISARGAHLGRALSDPVWGQPMRGPHAAYLTYSLIAATFFGAMGLPHVAVRFYTNRDGRAARRTTLAVLAMLSLFYLVPTIYGVLGRVFAPDLVATGHSDAVVLTLPSRILSGSPATGLAAVLGAGAFAAFLSTSSGLVVSVGGVVGQELLRPRLGGVGGFRIGSVAACAVALGVTVSSSGLNLAHAVELAFAVAASTFCPLLLLGIWWRGLTARGALVGLLVGAATSTTAVLLTMAGVQLHGWEADVVAQPALLTVPLAFACMVAFSLMSAESRPVHLNHTMVRLHTPEALALDRGPFAPE